MVAGAQPVPQAGAKLAVTTGRYEVYGTTLACVTNDVTGLITVRGQPVHGSHIDVGQ